MDNDSVVEQIVRSLSFEVEAIPQDNFIQLTTSTKSAPLNVKIRVRKKEEANFKHGVLSLPKPDQPNSIPERVRLVSSDQTIMSFNVVMEADFQTPKKKPRKNILSMFKPTICLGDQPNEDDYAYLPSKTYKADINEESTSKSEGALTNFTLAKNVDNDDTPSPLRKRNKKDIFGKCKPGGCLDPPFGEDGQPYSPAKVCEQTTAPEHAAKSTERATEPTTESKGRTSSIFSNKLFNWKRKSSNDEALAKNVIKKENKTESVLDILAGSLQASATYSNTIMTYPPTLNSSENLRIQEEKLRGSRIYNNSSKNSFNVHSGSYFIVPKKPKNVLDKNNTVKKVNDDNGSDLKVETIHKIPKDKKKIADHQDPDDDDKLTLQTKQSVSDFRGTEKCLVESLDSKIRNDLNQKPNDNIAPYDSLPLINTERIGLKIISLETDEGFKKLQSHNDLVTQELNSTYYTSISEQKPVVDDNSDVIRDYQSEYDEKSDDLLKSEDITLKKDITDGDENTERIGSKDILLGNYQGLEKLQIQGDLITKEPNSTFYVGIDNQKSVEDSNSDAIRDYQSEYNEKPYVLFKSEDITLKHNTTDGDESTERIGSKVIALQNDEGLKKLKTRYDDLVTQEPNFTYDAGKDKQQPVDDSNSDAVREYQTEYDEKPDDLLKSEDITIKDATAGYEVPSSERVADNQKSVYLNEPGFETYNETENIPQIQNVEENKYGDKSVVTIDAKHEMSIYDITGTFDENRDMKPNLENVIVISAKDLEDEGLREGPTPIERNTPLEMIYTENDDLQHIWSNKAHPLISDLELQIENELRTQIDSFNENMDTLAEQKNTGKETLTSKISINYDKISKNQNDLVENIDKDSFLTTMSNEADTETQTAKSKNSDSQTQVNILQKCIEHNSLFEDNSSTMFDQKHNDANQNLQDISFQIQASTTSNEAESGRNKGNDDILHYENLLEEITALTQTKTPSTFKETGQRSTSNDVNEVFGIETMDTFRYNDDIDQLGQNKYSTENIEDGEGNSELNLINDVTELNTTKEQILYKNKNVQQVQVSVGSTETAKQIADQNKADDKHVKKLTFDDIIKADSKKTKDATEITGFYSGFPDERSSSQTESSEITSKNTRPVLIDLAIQSYVDNNNQVIIKSYDADNAPKRYPRDIVKITKRYIETDDKITVPINAATDLYIQIKSNKQRDIDGVDGHNMNTDKIKKSINMFNFESESDHIKSNITIAEDLRTMLESIYEKELLPLRNTISELKDNVELLTTHQMLLKGHMFFKKPRPTKIVPLYRRCACMRK